MLWRLVVVVDRNIGNRNDVLPWGSKAAVGLASKRVHVCEDMHGGHVVTHGQNLPLLL